MNIFYSGQFGRRAANAAAALCSGATMIDMDGGGAVAAAGQMNGGTALVLLSDASGAGMDAMAAALRSAAVTWTVVHLYPAMLRVGPLVKAHGVCFDCATRRYLSAPGSEGLARLEELLRGAGSGPAIAFPTVPATVVEMAVSEALRQLEDPELPAGFMLKVDFVEHVMTSAVARPLHGCSCGGTAAEHHALGQRFYKYLEHDMLELTGSVAQ